VPKKQGHCQEGCLALNKRLQAIAGKYSVCSLMQSPCSLIPLALSKYSCRQGLKKASLDSQPAKHMPPYMRVGSNGCEHTICQCGVQARGRNSRPPQYTHCICFCHCLGSSVLYCLHAVRAQLLTHALAVCMLCQPCKGHVRVVTCKARLSSGAAIQCNAHVLCGIKASSKAAKRQNPSCGDRSTRACVTS